MRQNMKVNMLMGRKFTMTSISMLAARFMFYSLESRDDNTHKIISILKCCIVGVVMSDRLIRLL